MRNAEIRRDTAETKISISLTLEGTGKSRIDTGVGFLDHMLTLFAKHGRFDLAVKCNGDNYVDDHHSVEDIGISHARVRKELQYDASHSSARRRELASYYRGHIQIARKDT